MSDEIKRLSKEAAYYVSKGMSRDDACEKVLDLEQQRNDPDNQIQTGDNSDTRAYSDSKLTEPNIQNTAQINAIAKELEDYFDYENTEVDDFDLK